ncbi:MAG: R3H domain-containing nucleic acid-binding protein, partial [Vampirovibrionales bacterium]
ALMPEVPQAVERYRKCLVFTQYIVTQDDLDAMVRQLPMFMEDNRTGLPRTLHRISAMRNRQGDIIGLTCRVGRAIQGTVSTLLDLFPEEHRAYPSILFLGPPGVGKTTRLREMAYLLANARGLRVMVIDTSNEIAGDGDIPHAGIGRARRLQVASPESQARVMIEAVENHTPEVIIVDEIGTLEEAQAARTIAERGVMLIATAHGRVLENLIKNPTLSDLVGGIQSVTLSDEEARRRGTQKSILEREKPTTFQTLIELRDRDTLAIYHDLQASVDRLLRGETPLPEVRTLNQETGEVILKRPSVVALPAHLAHKVGAGISNHQEGSSLQGSPLTQEGKTHWAERSKKHGAKRHSERPLEERFAKWYGEEASATVVFEEAFEGGYPLNTLSHEVPLEGYERDTLGSQTPTTSHKLSSMSLHRATDAEARMLEEDATLEAITEAMLRHRSEHEELPPVTTKRKPFQVYAYGVSSGLLLKTLHHLHLEETVGVTKTIEHADAIITLRHQARAGSRIARLAQEYELPLYLIGAGSPGQLIQGIYQALKKATQDSAHQALSGYWESFLAASQEAVTSQKPYHAEPPSQEAQDAALRAVQEGITQVIETGTPVTLAPLPARLRRIQHETIEAHEAPLMSMSIGKEPQRRVCISLRRFDPVLDKPSNPVD